MPGKKPVRHVVSEPEERRINAAARRDADNPPLSDAELAAMRPASEVLPHVVAAFRRTRGPGRKPRKQQITLRLDPDIIAFFRSTGRGWQTRINDILRAHVRRHTEDAS